MIRKFAACMLVASLLAPTSATIAQSQKPSLEVKKEETSEETNNFGYADGLLDGRLAAEKKDPSKATTGVVTGVLTGLIGTGVGYFIVGPEQVPLRTLMDAKTIGREIPNGL